MAASLRLFARNGQKKSFARPYRVAPHWRFDSSTSRVVCSTTLLLLWKRIVSTRRRARQLSSRTLGGVVDDRKQPHTYGAGPPVPAVFGRARSRAALNNPLAQYSAVLFSYATITLWVQRRLGLNGLRIPLFAPVSPKLGLET